MSADLIDFPADHAETPGGGQGTRDPHSPPALSGTDPAQGCHDTQRAHGEGGEDGPRATELPATKAVALADPFLAFAADIVDDAEANRIANENRLRTLTGHDFDPAPDGADVCQFCGHGKKTEAHNVGELGFGLSVDHPDVAVLSSLVAALADVEHRAVLNLRRKMRKHPLGPWVKAQKGIGEKQAARLLAVLGDPFWHSAEGRPRALSELWSYAGHGDARRRPRKGMTQAELFACGSPVAKMRLHLIAAACLKAQGPFADVYYARKEATEGRVHAVECRRCGPSGKPALPGSLWSDGHRHADALRIVGKEVLRGLWEEARRLHEESGV